MNILNNYNILETFNMTKMVHAAELHTIQSFVALMVAAIIVGIVAHKIKLPYTVSLIIVGVVMSTLGLVPNINLTQELLLAVFLPALLFEAAIHFPMSELKTFSPTIVTLAAPGVLLTALATAIVLTFEFAAIGVEGYATFLHFLLFGTIIAATDPISVIALLKNMGVEKRLSLLIEGESLFNDGTAIVLCSVVLDVVLESRSFNITEACSKFIFVAIGGIFTGAILGLFASLMIRFINDHLISIAFTTVTAYGSYLVAENFEASGVLSTVTAGLFIGNISKKRGMKPNARIAVISFWEFIAFFMGSIVFLMMGLEVNITFLMEHLNIIALAFLAVLASRALSVFIPIPFLKKFMHQKVSFKDATIMWWGGLRGALSMVLALSLPEDLIVRDILIAMVFGVVVLSVVVQGSTMSMLLKWLQMKPKKTNEAIILNLKITRLQAIHLQLKNINNHIPQNLENIENIKITIIEEKNNIMKFLHNRRHKQNFKNALADHAKNFQYTLKQIAKTSYQKSLEDNLLNEKELNELILTLEQNIK